MPKSLLRLILVICFHYVCSPATWTGLNLFAGEREDAAIQLALEKAGMELGQSRLAVMHDRGFSKAQNRFILYGLDAQFVARNPQTAGELFPASNERAWPYEIISINGKLASTGGLTQALKDPKDGQISFVVRELLDFDGGFTAKQGKTVKFSVPLQELAGDAPADEIQQPSGPDIRKASWGDTAEEVAAASADALTPTDTQLDSQVASLEGIVSIDNTDRRIQYWFFKDRLVQVDISDLNFVREGQIFASAAPDAAPTPMYNPFRSFGNLNALLGTKYGYEKQIQDHSFRGKKVGRDAVLPSVGDEWAVKLPYHSCWREAVWDTPRTHIIAKASYFSSADMVGLETVRFIVSCELSYQAKTADAEEFRRKLQDDQAEDLERSGRRMSEQVEQDGL